MFWRSAVRRGWLTHHTHSLAPEDTLERTRGPGRQRWGGGRNWLPGAPGRALRDEVPPESVPMEVAASHWRQVARRAYPDQHVLERAGGDTAWELDSPSTSSFFPWGFSSTEPLLLFADGVEEKGKEMRKDSFPIKLTKGIKLGLTVWKWSLWKQSLLVWAHVILNFGGQIWHFEERALFKCLLDILLLNPAISQKTSLRFTCF